MLSVSQLVSEDFTKYCCNVPVTWGREMGPGPYPFVKYM